jgi:pantetheine-phosphate adenylyltransferase
MKIAIFPGSFDPITLGHEDIIRRGVTLFDEVIVAIGINAEKKYMFDLETRQAFIEKVFADEPKVKVVTYSGLTIDFCKKMDAQFILRGLRNPADFEFEKAIAHTNRKLSKIGRELLVFNTPLMLCKCLRSVELVTIKFISIFLFFIFSFYFVSVFKQKSPCLFMYI